MNTSQNQNDVGISYHDHKDVTSDKKYLKYQPREKNKILDLITSTLPSKHPEETVKRVLRAYRDHYLQNVPVIFQFEADQIAKRLTSESIFIDLGCWTGVLGKLVLDQISPKEYIGIDAGLWYTEISKEILPSTAKFRSFFILPDSAVDLNTLDKLYLDINDPVNTSGFYTRRAVAADNLSAMPIGKTMRPIDFANWLKTNYDLENLYLKMDIEGVDQELVLHLAENGVLPAVLHFELLEKFMMYWGPAKVVLEKYYDFIPPPNQPNQTYIIIAIRKGVSYNPTTLIYDKIAKTTEILGDL